jgi:hypothetical protein
MPFWENPAMPAVIGGVLVIAAAYVQIALASRAKAGEELRERRLDAYPVIWQETAVISSCPRVKVRGSELKDLHLRCRRWYYTKGGLFLSECSRDRYGDMQQLLSARIAKTEDLSDYVPLDAYTDLEKTCSAFRTALTQDLATRRQRSLVWLLSNSRWHRRQKRAIRQRLHAVGIGSDGIVSYPFDELKLPASEISTEPGSGEQA